MNFCKTDNIKSVKISTDSKHSIWVESFDAKIRDENFEVLFNYRLLASEGVTKPIFYAEGFQRMVNMWQKFVYKGSIAVDIGAYNGDTTLPLACLVGDNGTVIAFEPGLFYHFLNINCGLNPRLKIFPLNYAVMEEERIYGFLYDSAIENGGPQLNTCRTGKYESKMLVRALNLIKFLERHNIDFNRISFIKLDTEGYDMKILQSIQEIIVKVRPTIQIEWFHNTEQDIRDFIKKYNYHTMDCADKKEYNRLPPKWTDDLLLIPN